MFKLKLHWQILIALLLAVLAGLATGKDTTLLGVSVLEAYAFIGKLFLNALKMLIVPLVVSSIIVGIAGIGSSGALGRLGGKTLLYYIASSTLAILIGLAVVNVIAPGIADGEPVNVIDGDRKEEQGADDPAKIAVRLEQSCPSGW